MAELKNETFNRRLKNSSEINVFSWTLRSRYVRVTYTIRIRTDERTDEVVLSPTWLAKTWNENSGNLPKVKFPERLDAKRKKAAREALTSRSEAILWVEAIRRMATSDFCNGRKKSEGHENWKAKFDHLIRPGWIDRVLEGEFDNAGRTMKLTPFQEGLLNTAKEGGISSCRPAC